MAVKPAPGSAAVDALVAALDHPLKPVIVDVRASIIGSDPAIGERVKWNAPSFCYDGDDRVTFNVRPNGPLLLVFHRGARARATAGFSFADDSGLMDWKAPDRALVTIASLDDWAAHRATILALIPRWMRAVADAEA